MNIFELYGNALMVDRLPFDRQSHQHLTKQSIDLIRSEIKMKLIEQINFQTYRSVIDRIDRIKLIN